MALIWKDPITREIIVAVGRDRGLPLFGSVLPFIGWKWIGCGPEGEFIQTDDFSDPTHVRLCFGASWLGHGMYSFTSNVSTVRRAAG